LAYADWAEQEVINVPEMGQIESRPAERIGVVGGGTMGAGITVALLDAGFSVILIERDADSLDRGRTNVHKVYDALVSKGRLEATERDARLGRLSGSTAYESLATADLVIEAVFEDMGVKAVVFTELDRVCRPGAVLASNTSYLNIDALAATISRPQDVIGLHFFSPAHVMKLLEVVVPAHVADDVVVTAFALARRLKKVPVRAGVCDGFIGNRILATYRQAADYLLADGASPYQIDAAIRAFGFPMGPFQVYDLAGGDIGWATRKRRAAARDPRLRYVPMADRLCERGWFGQKTGRGWYRYPDGARTGIEDPEVLAIVEEERRLAGWVSRPFDDVEIQRRLLAAMVNEGARIIQERIALRALDVDVVMLRGYGFPRERGGLMYHADQIGLTKILADIRSFAADDPIFWQPAPLLLELAQCDKTFTELNQTSTNKES
jgi:3-hydroxyacyl-CoA dehydrogenase